jgi:hypothetical protein
MAQIPHANKGLICPLHKQDMSKVCHKCPLWTQVRGKNPQNGEDIDHWNCAIAWLPMMLVENSQMQRQTGAAVESFRNEMVKANGVSTQLFLEERRNGHTRLPK